MIIKKLIDLGVLFAAILNIANIAAASVGCIHKPDISITSENLEFKSYIKKTYYTPCKLTFANNDNVPYKIVNVVIHDPKEILKHARHERNKERFPYTLEPYGAFGISLFFPQLLFARKENPPAKIEYFNMFVTKPVTSFLLSPYHFAIGFSENKLAKKESLLFNSKDKIVNLEILPGKAIEIFSITQYVTIVFENPLIGEKYRTSPNGIIYCVNE